MKKISILGSTGSIGTQTLDVISYYPHLFQVESLAAGTNLRLLKEQITQYQPKLVAVSTSELAIELKNELNNEIDYPVEIMHGMEGLLAVATYSSADFVVSALVGSLGLKPTFAAIKAGKTVGLANKESLVSAGHLVTQAAKEHGVDILPIDSEHSAIFQSLHGGKQDEIHKITITASGGAFRDLNRDQLKDVTLEQALKHPNWAMGAKVTIDSATMANKGLEVIEAHWLFDIPYENIDVLIHPQSIVHSMVEFNDASVIAQLGIPDMTVPIQYALSYPDRIPTGKDNRLDLAAVSRLDFREASFDRYPALRLAYESGKVGGTATTVFNAANEKAVALFMEKRIPFLNIEYIVEQVLHRHDVKFAPSLEEIEEVDRWARHAALDFAQV
ncbi:1-deoxy-D-xylulose-5-phosphate reductoisomerase [Longirhabdus pacifica]|uniref:1-deoxy-D-xylulose-5-phosphate reductoisomerase n=1 Tax=Longirhabdus pacifica TaxID=2305227 RepID=UPI001008C024|nr:1-deoxy-D-xylulose-5-phosphate reductoisomerase [Longirhabdus pacifica]